MVKSSLHLPDCVYKTKPVLVTPSAPTPKNILYLSNLDDQKFLRFTIKYVYVYKTHKDIARLRESLSRVLVDYYPLAGRLRVCKHDEDKLEVNCNGEGAVFAHGYMDMTSDDFLECSNSSNVSWRKLLWKVDCKSFLDIPPLVIQVTSLSCGGMILCTAINHCFCDGIGSSQFLHAWASLTANPTSDILIQPSHDRCMLKPGKLPSITFTHPEFANTAYQDNPQFELSQIFQSQSLVPLSLTFTASDILSLKRKCAPPLKCTSFETLASHTWQCWINSLNLPSSLSIKLLFSASIRHTVNLPQGYYGNGFVLACAETTVDNLVNNNIHNGIQLVQQARKSLVDDYVRSMIDFLEVNRVKPDLGAALVISPWTKLGLEDLDFGEGKPLHMGPLVSEMYCVFVPVVGSADSVKVVLSLPESIADKFVYCMNDLYDEVIK